MMGKVAAAASLGRFSHGFPPTSTGVPRISSPTDVAMVSPGHRPAMLSMMAQRRRAVAVAARMSSNEDHAHGDEDGSDNKEASSTRIPNLVTFSSTISTDVPLHEPPGVSFDEYIEDLPRVFQAMFPDKQRSSRLNHEEWRIRMLPIQFLVASVRPVVDIRLTCKPTCQSFSSRVLQLHATRWKLQGLDESYMPSHFSLRVHGGLYADRSGEGGSRMSRLKGRLEMGVSFVLPGWLAMVPEDLLRGVAESVLQRLAERMKREVDVSLLSDFRSFRIQRMKKHGQNELRGDPRSP